MQFLCLLISFACALLAPVVTSARANVLPPPQFEPLFIATLDILSIQNLTGPFGTRVHSTTRMFVNVVFVFLSGLLTHVM